MQKYIIHLGTGGLAHMLRLLGNTLEYCQKNQKICVPLLENNLGFGVPFYSIFEIQSEFLAEKNISQNILKKPFIYKQKKFQIQNLSAKYSKRKSVKIHYELFNKTTVLKSFSLHIDRASHARPAQITTGTFYDKTSWRDGESVITALSSIKLNSEISCSIQKTKESLPSKFIGVHFRNTDKKADFNLICNTLKKAIDETGLSDIYWATDDSTSKASIQKLFPELKIFNFSNIFDVKKLGFRNLHRVDKKTLSEHGTSKEQQTIDVFTDIYLLSLSEKFIPTPRSGLSGLVEIFREKPELLSRFYSSEEKKSLANKAPFYTDSVIAISMTESPAPVAAEGEPAAPLALEAPRVPPEEIPVGLRDRYTLGGTIPVQAQYFNQTKSEPRRLTLEKYKKALKALKAGTFRYYGNTLPHILAAAKDFPLTCKHVCVFGAVNVNCDAIALSSGAEKVDILEYNVPVTEHPQVECLSLREALQTGLQWDAALSISSFEHDGLGRYGDPLDPDGDLRAMSEARRMLKPGGLLYLAVPVGPDCVVWNAHRVYGKKRLPMLLDSWEVVKTYGYSKKSHDLPVGKYTQPVFVLRKKGRTSFFGINISESDISHCRDEIKSAQLEVFEFLRPKSFPRGLVRVGGNHDGAYLLPSDSLETLQACISPGVRNKKAFEDELAKSYRVPSHMCDKSSNEEHFSTPIIRGMQTFRKVWLDKSDSEDSISLKTWLEEEAPGIGDLLLQMDIEGAEYRILLDAPDKILNRFRVMVLELHQLQRINQPGALFQVLLPMVRKLSKNFVCVHAHPNNVGPVFEIQELNVRCPRTLEVSFLRKDRFPSDHNFFEKVFLPHPLDIPRNARAKPPIFLDEAWIQGGIRPKESLAKMDADIKNYKKRQKSSKIKRPRF